MSPTPHTFDEQGMRRAVATIRRVERMVINVAARLRTLESRPGRMREDCIVGRFASEVAAKSGDTMSSGEMTVYDIDRETGEWSATSRTETVWNSTGNTITADKNVTAHRHFKSGLWLGIVEDCA